VRVMGNSLTNRRENELRPLRHDFRSGGSKISFYGSVEPRSAFSCVQQIKRLLLRTCEVLPGWGAPAPRSPLLNSWAYSFAAANLYSPLQA